MQHRRWSGCRANAGKPKQMIKLLLMLPLVFLILGCEKDTSKRCEALKAAVQKRRFVYTNMHE
jgi:hypothetical protein